MNIIFDLDGTLIDSAFDIAKYINITRKKCNLPPVSVDFVKQNLGNGAERLVKGCMPEVPFSKEILDYYNEIYTACDFSLTVLFDGVKEMLERLKGKHNLVVISNKPQQTVDEIIKKFFGGVFNLALGGRENAPLKPQKELFLEINKYITLDPKETVMVGDGDTDYLFAKNCGLNYILVDWGYRKVEDLKALGGENFAHTTSDIINFIESL